MSISGKSIWKKKFEILGVSPWTKVFVGQFLGRFLFGFSLTSYFMRRYCTSHHKSILNKGNSTLSSNFFSVFSVPLKFYTPFKTNAKISVQFDSWNNWVWFIDLFGIIENKLYNDMHIIHFCPGSCKSIQMKGEPLSWVSQKCMNLLDIPKVDKVASWFQCINIIVEVKLWGICIFRVILANVNVNESTL